MSYSTAKCLPAVHHCWGCSSPPQAASCHAHSLFSIYLLEYVNKDHSFGHAPPHLRQHHTSHSQPFLNVGSNNYKNMLTKALVLNKHCEKRLAIFPSPSWDVTYQTLSGGEYLNYFRLGRVWLVTSRLGTGKSLIFFTVYFDPKPSGISWFYLVCPTGYGGGI